VPEEPAATCREGGCSLVQGRCRAAGECAAQSTVATIGISPRGLDDCASAEHLALQPDETSTQSVNPVENLQEDLEQSTFERDLEPTMPELEANEFHNGRGACQTLEATWPIGRSGTGLTAAVAAAACLGEAFESSAAALASTTALEQLSRLMQAIAIPHVYGFMPSWSSRGRLSALITAYGLEERAVSADGNCQFASASDQLFGTPALHASVREAVVRQLRADPDRYCPFVFGQSFPDYAAEMARNYVWGDHVTLQALADAFGVRVMLLTSFEHAPDAIVITPQKVEPDRAIWLSFWAEFHYGSLYPKGDVPGDSESTCCIA